MEPQTHATDDQLFPSDDPVPEDDIVLQTTRPNPWRGPPPEVFNDGVTELPSKENLAIQEGDYVRKREKEQKWKIFSLSIGAGAGSKHQSPEGNDQTGGCYWPLDLVPKDFTNLRVLTYGYDSHPTHFYASQTTQMTISQHAQQLLQQVTNARADCRRRPIIFVAHSLGGVLVKDAIIQSGKYADQPHLQDISTSCHAICFFGTPHRGSNAARYGETLANLISIAPGSPSAYKEVLRGLKLDSEKLNQVEADFGSLLNKNIPSS